MRAIITTIPFGEIDAKPLRLLAAAGVDYVINPIGRKLKAAEVAGVVSGFDIIIAGTEVIGSDALRSPQLKAICRVGIGLDGVDLVEARRRGIAVSYTPEGPSAAVAELAIGQMIALLRKTSVADRRLRTGVWHRHFGRRLSLCTIGVVGCGRIGSRVVAHLQGGFPGAKILAHDIVPEISFPGSDLVRFVGLNELLAQSDIITLHLPLTGMTRGMIAERELAAMKRDAILINTSRGGIINETALAEALTGDRLGGAAIDVFEDEPYIGPLAQCENTLLSCHMGSMTEDCRLRMEVEAVEEALRFATGQPFLSPVPEFEYDLAISRENAVHTRVDR